MKKHLNTILISLAIGLLSFSASYLLIQKEQKKIVVVDAIKLFNSYNMKKELEKEVDGRLKYMAHLSDSLEQQLKFYPDASKAPKELIYSYQTLRNNIDAEFEKANRSINEQVWKRLNPLIAKYGKANNLHVIIGANGMGTVLYNSEAFDLTDDLTKYINKEYEGK